jgi:hypothetical protein
LKVPVNTGYLRVPVRYVSVNIESMSKVPINRTYID